MEKEEVTNEDLARMVQDGFIEVRTEMQGGFNEVHKELNEIKEVILESHSKRIDALESELKSVKEQMLLK